MKTDKSKYTPFHLTLTCVYSHVHIVTHRSSDHRTVYMEVVCVHVQYE